MSILSYAIVRSAKRTTILGPCRRVARRRIAQPCRTFRTSALLRASQEPDDSKHPADSAAIQRLVDEAVRKATAGFGSNSHHGEEKATEDTRPAGDPARPIDRSYYGSRRRRAARGTQQVQMTVPEWFVDEKITLWQETPALSANARSEDQPTATMLGNKAETDSSEEQSKITIKTGEPPTQSQEQNQVENISTTVLLRDRYEIQENIFEEIKYMTAGGLRAASAQPTEDALLSRPHLLLQSPQSGSEAFLNEVVKAATTAVEADLIQIDAQDIAAIGSNLPDALPEQTVAAVKRLGFDAYVYDEDQDPEPSDEGHNDPDALDDAMETPVEDRSRSTPLKLPSLNLGNLKPLQHVVQLWLPSRARQSTISQPRQDGHSSIADFFTGANGVTTPHANTQQDFVQALLRGFLDSPHLKRRRDRLRSQSNNDGTENTLMEAPRSLVVHVRDYLELSATSIGRGILDNIHAAVDAKRRDGQQVLLIGTSAAADLFPAAVSEEGFQSMQAGNENDRLRTIVTMCANEEAEAIFADDASKRTTEINIRNLQALIRELYPEASLQSHKDIWASESELRNPEQFQFDPAKSVWPLEKVQRLITLAHGLAGPTQQINAAAILRARTLMRESDKEKTKWASHEKSLQSPEFSTTAPNVQEEQRKALLKKCDRYEKKLMSGVVDAQKIKTSFADVHVPPSSIEAVKTLTTLSLIRPDAFSYGVLATDKIPGLLLYGPPGTGKTMLAKAVAKESGATVLEVSGSEVYDMYVGEGEKNVRAIFSLARKLSPCVVFIDEADAIFGSRSGGHNRRSHRELINQFLKEWDGMNELSTFIMVATNRPFDLDDAVLRRLPRRLLVDLPTEKDREAILRIHLKDEIVEPDVSLLELASRTPFYSGSDLKNVAVAAALACVKEENEAATKAEGSPYQFPSKRRLTKAHFESALAEISASISEDMSSLKAIRQFDERYGDRRGRKKNSGGLGFGTRNEKDQERERLDGGRVRKLELAV